MLAMMWGNTAFPPRALAKRSSEVSPAIALLEERACQTNSTVIRFFFCLVKFRQKNIRVK